MEGGIKKGRRYGFACSNCRRRKAKCDGEQPACRKCVAANEACHYDQKPSVAFAASLQRKLKAYEDRIEQLRHVKDSERDALLADPISPALLRGGRARAPSPPTTSSAAVTTDDAEISAPEAALDTAAPEESTLGIDGEVEFYGRTSLFRADSPAGHEGGARSTNDFASPRSTIKSPESRSVEREEMRSFIAEISPTVLTEVLDTYWCWPHHLHNVLCKKVFLRDLDALGPLVTPFSLGAVLAQSCRYSPRPDASELGEHFAQRTLEMLVKDIDRGSSIPTIQGLLIFSARECACGRTAQGWLYSGMAIRMARDMGIHLNPTKLGPLSSHFSEEELKLRQQLFWSCYTWDKTMSLCFGRAPTMVVPIDIPTVEDLLDGHDADNEVWRPESPRYALSDGLLQHRALSSTRFIKYCELYVIVNDILDKLYSRPHHGERDHMIAYLTHTLEKLDNWSASLPAELLAGEGARTVLCPPVHILLLNLLYYTSTILLCRPYRRVSQVARTRCTEAARMTDVLFTLHVRRFGFRCITWLQTYTMFVACTINVCDLKESLLHDQSTGQTTERSNLAEEAGVRLGFGLEVLRQAESTPSATKCASILMQLLKNLGIAKEARLSGERLPGRAPETNEQVQPLSRQGTDGQNTTHSDINEAFNTSQSGTFDDPYSQTLPNRNRPTSNQLFAEQIDPLGGQFDFDGIETPLRWLPENVYNDGSWMLMDVDFAAFLDNNAV